MNQRKVQKILLLAFIVFSYSINATLQPAKVGASPEAITQRVDPRIQIQLINLAVKVGNRYVLLEKLTSEVLNPEEATIIPQVINGSTIRVNASYTTIIGDNRSLVMHEFAVDVYQVRSGEPDTLNRSWAVVYRDGEPEELILTPGASKTEVLDIPSFLLPAFGTYKFVFRVKYHTYQGTVLLPRDSIFPRNMTFEFIAGLPPPPEILFYLFFFVSFIFIAFIALGVYGDRRYK
ncbi:MAG: hypothetical protein ACFFE8_13735 [Candidatus Heimdallarchaeota archaeon]